MIQNCNRERQKYRKYQREKNENVRIPGVLLYICLEFQTERQ